MSMNHTQKPTLNSQCSYGVAGRAPSMDSSETLVFDEEGRCSPQVNGKGSTDYHSHHYRVFKSEHGGHRFAVKHGGGEESFKLYEYTRVVEMLAKMDSDSRYLMLHALHRSDGQREAREAEALKWRQAAAEKRIKTRKERGSSSVKVWIEPKKVIVEA